MNKKYLAMFGLIITLSLIVNVTALDFEKENRLAFGHVMKIKDISVTPSNLVPGREGILKLSIENTAKFEIRDIRVQINLPDEISFLDDISKRKIAILDSGISQELEYDIIVSSETDEGVYKIPITVDYINFIGDERQDNDSFGIIIKSVPKLFIKAEDSNLYEKGDIGDITLTFVNNDIGNIKFLTIELLESENYNVVSVNKDYIGDLDSDDFESVDFKIRLNTKNKEIPLLLRLNYKDALNQDYTQELDVNLNILTAAERGEKTTNVWSIIFWIIVICGIGYWIYNKKFKKKSKK